MIALGDAFAEARVAHYFDLPVLKSFTAFDPYWSRITRHRRVRKKVRRCYFPRQLPVSLAVTFGPVGGVPVAVATLSNAARTFGRVQV